MSYTQFSRDDRFKLESWLEIGLAQAEIAFRLNKDPSSIRKELKRNSYPDGKYDARHACKLVALRRKAGKRSSKKMVKDWKLTVGVLNGLRAKKSPEQICGRRKLLGMKTVSHETIYQYLYTERPDLVCFLRQKKRKYRRRHGTKSREKSRELEKKKWITERPPSIDERKEIGHWEGDTVRGKEKTTAIATHVERVSGFACASLLLHATAINVHLTTVENFKRIPRLKRLSETRDNGKEFESYEATEKALKMPIYFALPYHSWERGSNENWNGLLRQFFPKGTPFAKLTQRDIDRAVRNLNNRPRKRLNYLTPYEVFVKGLSVQKRALQA